MTKKEELFTKWFELKYDIQTIAAIVQNVNEIDETELANWLGFVAHFKTKFQVLHDATVLELKK